MGNSNLRDLEVLIAQAETLSFRLGDKPADLNPDELERPVEMLCPSFEDRFEFAPNGRPIQAVPRVGFLNRVRYLLTDMESAADCSGSADRLRL
jgi:hypothetical protein